MCWIRERPMRINVFSESNNNHSMAQLGNTIISSV